MSYFVVERSGDGGELRIPLPTAYETREAAIAALSQATGSGEVTLIGEVFIADLGAAVPVLVMAAAAPVPATATPAEESVVETPADEPEVEEAGESEDVASPEVEEAAEPESEDGADVVETQSDDFMIEEPAEPAALDEESADEVYTSWAPIPDVTTRGASLADAIKRATTTLEDEGVVAPDSILTEPAADESPTGEPFDLEEALGEATQEPPVAQGVEGEATAEWPWANIESYEVPDESEPADPALEDGPDVVAVVAEPAGVAPIDQDVEAIVDSLGEDAPIITSAPPEGEEAYMPHPVILGDYADALPVIETLADDLAAAPEGEPVDLEAGEGVVPTADGSAGLADAEEPGIEVAEIPLEGGYAPTGELDLGEYTCQDCVYSNTCPKVGQVTPIECGSFQWKSE